MSYFSYEDELENNPECYRCGEECYWHDRELYDFDIDEPHVCKDKMLADADDFEM